MRRGLLASILGHVLLLVVIGVIAAVVDRWQPPPDAVEPAGIEIVADGYRGQAVVQSSEAPQPEPPASPPRPDAAPDAPPAPPAPPPPAALPPAPDAMPVPPLPPRPPVPPPPPPPLAPPPPPPPAPPDKPPADKPTPASTTPPSVNLGRIGLRPEEVERMAVVPPQADKSNNPPIPPPEAVRLRQQGSVTLRIHVAGDGYVTAVDVTEASGYPLLDNAARMAVFAWHYKPGRGADGNPAPSTVEVIIEFTQ